MYHHRIGQPRGAEYSSYQACRLELPDLFNDELLSLQSLLPDLLLDGSRVRTDSNMVLNHLPRNARDVRCLPCKHVGIRPQEGDERDFLFAVKGGAYGKSSTCAIHPNGDLLGFWWGHLGPLAPAGGALWHVLNGNAALCRGAFAGGGAGVLAGLRSLAGRGLAGRGRGLVGFRPSRGLSGRNKALAAAAATPSW